MIKTEDLQSLQSGHRARLREKFLDGKLTEYEILELLLTYATLQKIRFYTCCADGTDGIFDRNRRYQRKYSYVFQINTQIDGIGI